MNEYAVFVEHEGKQIMSTVIKATSEENAKNRFLKRLSMVGITFNDYSDIYIEII